MMMKRNSKILAVGVMLTAAVFSGCEKETSASGEEPVQNEKEEVSVVEAPDPTVGGMKVEPEGGDLDVLKYVRVSFPVDMVDQSDVGKSRVSPVEVVPDGLVKFVWTSTRGGILETRMMDNAKVMRRLRLVGGLEDFSGNPVDVEGWGAEFAKQDLEVLNVVFADEDGEFSLPDPNRKLGGRQRVSLTFSRDVLPSDIAESLAFIDSDTKRRHGVKVALEQEQADRPQGIVIVEPAEPLPVDTSFWLVVERLDDYAGSHPLPHLRVYPAGRTSPLELTWTRAYNQPQTGSFVRLGFNRRVDMNSVKDGVIRIDPPVEISGVEREKSSLIVRADFKNDTTYSVTVGMGLLSEDGSPLAEEKTVDLEMPLRRPAIVLDSPKVSVPVGEFDFGLRLCRTKDVKWRIAAVPREKYQEVSGRLKEFGKFARDDDYNPILDPRDETVRYVDTDPLIPALRLEPVAEGTLRGEAGDELVGRSFNWPEACVKSGLYLVEFEGLDEDRREIGNRCLVNMRDMVIRKYAGEGDTFFHVAQGADGSPVQGASLFLYSQMEDEPTEVVTGDLGFASAAGASASYLFVEKDGVTAFHELSGDCNARANFTGRMPSPRAVLITNGDVFRPGDTVTYSGVVRLRGEDGSLVIPNEEVTLSVYGEDTGGGDTGFFPNTEEGMNALTLGLDDLGMFGGEFEIPGNALSGTYLLTLSCGTYQNSHDVEVAITVADFRKPDVLLGISAPDTVGDSAEATITSEYFHGAPQAGAKVTWRAEWVSSDWAKDRLDDEDGYNEWDNYEFDDRYSPDTADQGIEGILSAMRSKVAGTGYFDFDPAERNPVIAVERGEGVLDENGVLKVATTCPFNMDSGIRRAKVLWVVEVQGEAGEVNRQVAVQGMQFAEQVLGIRTFEDWERGIYVELKSLNMRQEEGNPFMVTLEVMRREVKVTKESVGANVVRYRNTPVFKTVHEAEMLTNGETYVPVSEPGDYVVVAKAKDKPGVGAVSSQVIGVMNESQGPVLDDFSAEAIPEREAWTAGEEAVIRLRTPLTGWAHVTVEAGKRIEILPLMKINGTADKIKVPMKASYFPNCFVTIYVYQDSVDGGRPLERRAICELKVRDPQRELEVTPVLSAPTVAPRDEVTGTIRVSVLDRPVANARVVVGVIDEALLALGEWKLPDPVSSMHPRRPRVFETARSMGKSWYAHDSGELSHSQKGYILGDGGEFGVGQRAFAVRENDIPRPFWQGDGVTDSEGNFRFSFKAPDQLTSYRVFTVAVSGVESAGSGATKLRVSQDLRLKPFLPRFVREGDRLELRCRIECDANADGGMEVEFGAKAESGVRLDGEASRKVRIEPGKSEVVSIPAVIDEATAGKDAVLLFSASGREGFRDMVRVRIPVKDAHVLRTEHRGETLAAGDALSAEEVLGSLSSTSDAECSLFISGTRWMPKLASMSSRERSAPTLADLGGSALGSILMLSLDGFLPGELSRRDSVERDFQEAMRVLETSVIRDAGFGWFPRWPGSAEPDGATTALTALAVGLAKEEFNAYMEQGTALRGGVPFMLEDTLMTWRRAMLGRSAAILMGSEPSDFEKCVALAMEASGEGMVEDGRLKGLLRDLYEHRESLGLESKCFLSLADFLLKSREYEPVFALSEDEAVKLIEEITREDAPENFNPHTLGTGIRAEAIRMYVVSRVSQGMGRVDREEFERLVEPILQGGLDLTAQENLWVLLAARSAISLENPAIMAGRVEAGLEENVSPNGVTLAWLGHPASELKEMLSQPLNPGVESQWLVRVSHHEPIGEARGGEALGLSRQVTNLTAPERDGSESSPFRLGDYVLLEYQMDVGRDAYQVELDEHLPAALETVNPDLPSVRRTFPLPPMDEDKLVNLSHVDRRAGRVRMYFEHLPPGEASYAILTKVVGAGEFRWPAAGAVPMYDKRVQATTVDVVIHSGAD